MKRVLSIAVLALCAVFALAQRNSGTAAPGSQQQVQTPAQSQAGSQAPQGFEAIPDRQVHPESARGQERIIREVRHELVMLPQYSVFDNLMYKVEGNTVTLLGQVHDPVLKDSAEKVVKHIEGVDLVVNNIQVLPASPSDDRIRLRVARAIFNQPMLAKYAWSAVPPIHIIVDKGHVTLAGVVDNQSDKNVAGIQANSVPGVFSVQNNLQIATEAQARK